MVIINPVSDDVERRVQKGTKDEVRMVVLLELGVREGAVKVANGEVCILVILLCSCYLPLLSQLTPPFLLNT